MIPVSCLSLRVKGLFGEGLLEENTALDPDGLVSFPLGRAVKLSSVPLAELIVASSKERLKLCKLCSGNSSRGEDSKASESLCEEPDTLSSLLANSSLDGAAIKFASCRR